MDNLLCAAVGFIDHFVFVSPARQCSRGVCGRGHLVFVLLTGVSHTPDGVVVGPGVYLPRGDWGRFGDVCTPCFVRGVSPLLCTRLEVPCIGLARLVGDAGDCLVAFLRGLSGGWIERVGVLRPDREAFLLSSTGLEVL